MKLLPTLLVLVLFSAFQFSNLLSLDAQVGVVFSQQDSKKSVDSYTYEANPTVFSAHFEE